MESMDTIESKLPPPPYQYQVLRAKKTINKKITL